MGSNGSTYNLDSLPRLVGAALALGAERVPTLSKAELDLCREIKPIWPDRQRLRRLRESVLNGLDPLGDAFCVVRSPETRRVDGAIYTPPSIIQAMVSWAVDGPPATRVVDPGSGSARFTIAAGLALPKAELLAIELDPVAALLSRANIAVMEFGRRARVELADFRSLKLKPAAGRTIYIGNPPYVRHHNISPTWKHWLTTSAGGRGLSASQLAGLHVHFFLATVLHAQAGDRGAFITSSEWLDVNYGELVRHLILDGLGGRSIHVIAPEAQPFEDTQTTGAITSFEIGSTPSSVRLHRVKSVERLGKLAGGHPVRRERLAEARRWTPLLRAARKVPPGHIELGEICRVHRGAVTGANRVWVVDPSRSDLPNQVLFRSVTRAKELFAAGNILANAEGLRAVIDIPADLDQLDPSDRRAVQRFLKAARRTGAHEGYVARHRRAWWSVGLRKPAPILATYMARQPPAFVRNAADARHINIAHGIYPRESVSDAMLDRIATALRSTIDLADGRTYAGGLTKFEPKEMERLLIPDVTQETP